MIDAFERGESDLTWKDSRRIGCLSFYVILSDTAWRVIYLRPRRVSTRIIDIDASTPCTSASTSVSAHTLHTLTSTNPFPRSKCHSNDPHPLHLSSNPPPANPAKQPKMSSSSITNTPTPLPASAGMQVKRLSERATLPTRGSPLAAGYDLYA